LLDILQTCLPKSEALFTTIPHFLHVACTLRQCNVSLVLSGN
jgi:hypothetical protein